MIGLRMPLRPPVQDIRLGALSMVASAALFAAMGTQVGPFIYAGPVFAGFLDWWIWSSLPDALFVLGAGLVVLAAVLMLRRSALPAAALVEA